MRLLDNPHRSGPAVKALSNLPSALGIGARLVARRHTVQAERELGGSSTGSFGVHGDCVPVDVSEVVAKLVVAGVVGGSSTGEQARGRDAELQEGDVVGGRAEVAGTC